MKKGVFTKIFTLALVAAVAATASVAGTLAYLTDRDSKANVFTVGDVAIELNENFDDGAELIPGVRIEKEATITNTGDTDAWVWMTVALPAVLDDENTELGSANVLHWNMPGCFWYGYHDNQKYIQSGIKDGYLPAGSTGVADEDSWINDNKAVKETIDGIEYNVYTFKYVGAIEPGETTNIGLSRVFLDENLDINTDGQWYIVENGTATKVNWNSDTDGTPKVIVSAYAIQKDNFNSVNEAYDAYQKQWGENGDEYADTPVQAPSKSDESWIDSADTSWYGDGSAVTYEISTAEELAGLAKIVNEYVKSENFYDYPFNGKTITLTADIDLSGKNWIPIGIPNKTVNAFWGTFDGNGHTIRNMYAEGADGVGLFGAIFFGGDAGKGMATVKDVTVDNATIVANQYAGVVVGHSYGNIIDCIVKNATISANEEAGAIVGSTPSDAAPISVSNNTAENVNITAEEHVGAMLGRAFDSCCTREGNTWTNVLINGEIAAVEVGSLNK